MSGFNRDVIETYANGGHKLRQSILGLEREDLLAVPVPNTWSIQQIVIHMMDSDLIWTDRAKRVIAEDNPTLIGYDESKFAKNLHYDQWPADDALLVFDLNRKNFAKVLRLLPDSAFDRCGTHNEAGKLSLGQMIGRISDHVEHHVKFIYDKREMLGKSMW
jgi:hypothetical protein